MKCALALAIFVLWELDMFDTFTHCLTAEGYLQGWLGVGFHLFTLFTTWFAAVWFTKYK